MKTCTFCQNEKDMSEFYKDNSWCKDCVRTAMRETRARRTAERSACTCGAHKKPRRVA